MAPLMTLRLTPQNAFPHIQWTCDVIQHYVKFYGRTAHLKRSEGQQDYFEVEFLSQEEAEDAINNCTIPHMTFAWAAENISDNPATGPAEVSFKPPRRDRDEYSTLPSVPLPCNNPFANKWRVPKQIKRKRGQPQPPPEPVPVVCCRPRRVQIAAANPKAPFDKRYWPKFPIYPPTPRQ